MSTSLGFVYLNLVCNEMEQKGNFCDHDFSTVVKIILALYTYLLCSANDPLKVTAQLMELEQQEAEVNFYTVGRSTRASVSVFHYVYGFLLRGLLSLVFWSSPL
ncbi:hypothetical protein AB3S75_019658 [Citrus x aurantiifolia]